MVFQQRISSVEEDCGRNCFVCSSMSKEAGRDGFVMTSSSSTKPDVDRVKCKWKTKTSTPFLPQK